MPDVQSATREVYWNISQIWVMYALLVPTLLIAGYGVYRRVHRWRRGTSLSSFGRRCFDRPFERLQRVLRMALLQLGVWRDPLSGALHAMLFWGCLTLLAATTVVFVHHDFNVPIMRGRFYLYFQSLFVDVLGFLALVGTILFGVRRWLWRPKQLVFTAEATLILSLLGLILISGFLLEGWRIAVTNDPWKAWSPVGLLVANASSLVAPAPTLKVAHTVVWWGHLVLVFGLIAWAPYTKLFHVITAPLSIYVSPLDTPLARLQPIDFEQAETFGVNRLEHFSWRDLLELDACTECGRCTDVCPAHSVGKGLSPRDLILDLQRHQAAGGEGPIIDSSPALSADVLWECTTCAACVEACPVSISQLTKIIDMRRFLMMEEAEAPRGMQEAVTSIEQRGHPFRGAQASRTDWSDGLNVPHVDSVSDVEVLLWVGCGGALVERNQRTTRAFAELLQLAGVKFGILGRDEACSGDPARRVGNEFLFDMLAKQNVESLQSRDVRVVVTSCPHCFNTFRNEYPQFGGEFEVYHHTTYLAKLIGENRLQLDPADLGSLTLHDPCYLGRHNGITSAPRELLRKSSRQPVVEMKQHGKQSYCCGGGGGLSYVDEAADQRVNASRAKQALETGAETVAVACPFCTTMLEDGLAAEQGERSIEVKDIAEIVLAAVRGEAVDGAEREG